MSTHEFIFPFNLRDRKAFTADDSPLIPRWAEKYPFLFDELDVRTAKNQAPVSKGGFHFFEWLAAILFFEATGKYSLVEGYQGAKHERKQEILRRLLTDTQRSLVLNTDRTFKAQAPDLLVYDPGCLSYFFCEVKGPRDRMRPKAGEFFRAIGEACGKPVVIAHFVPCDDMHSMSNGRN